MFLRLLDAVRLKFVLFRITYTIWKCMLFDLWTWKEWMLFDLKYKMEGLKSILAEISSDLGSHNNKIKKNVNETI